VTRPVAFSWRGLVMLAVITALGLLMWGCAVTVLLRALRR
jgi:hypothetical protein